MAARRVALPAADDLFRPTSDPAEATGPRAVPAPKADAEPAAKQPSGRVRHDEKMTVYLTSDELLELEHARLTLRKITGSAVDRGRVVREALAIILGDLAEHGEASQIAERLRTS